MYFSLLVAYLTLVLLFRREEENLVMPGQTPVSFIPNNEPYEALKEKAGNVHFCAFLVTASDPNGKG